MRSTTPQPPPPVHRRSCSARSSPRRGASPPLLPPPLRPRSSHQNRFKSSGAISSVYALKKPNVMQHLLSNIGAHLSHKDEAKTCATTTPAFRCVIVTFLTGTRHRCCCSFLQMLGHSLSCSRLARCPKTAGRSPCSRLPPPLSTPPVPPRSPPTRHSPHTYPLPTPPF
jgi:hypothetical protein